MVSTIRLAVENSVSVEDEYDTVVSSWFRPTRSLNLGKRSVTTKVETIRNDARIKTIARLGCRIAAMAKSANTIAIQGLLDRVKTSAAIPARTPMVPTTRIRLTSNSEPAMGVAINRN